MKLNLLPATVSRGKSARTATVVSVILVLAGIGVAYQMITTSNKALADAKSAASDEQPAADKALSTSALADTIMSDPKVAMVVRNAALAQAMIKHNDVYPDLYNSLKPYIPPFFRLTSLVAQPLGADQASITYTGTLTSFQQYADLMLALMRNPIAVSVARNGYQSDDEIVPNLTQTDQGGAARKPNEGVPPEDPLQRLAFFASQPDPNVYSGAGNYGSGEPVTRGAMPGESLITVTEVVKAALQTPDPRSTLAASGGGGGAVSFGGVGPGGPPPGVGGPPPGAIGGRGRGGAGSAASQAGGANQGGD